MLKSGIKLGQNKGLKTSTVSTPVLPLPKKGKEIDLGETSVFHNIEVQRGDISQAFNFKDNTWLTVGDGVGKQEYFSRKGMKKTSVRWGQLKLLNTELQFFNKYWDSTQVPFPIVVYAGAAPGNHINILSKMFPSMKFYLYDTKTFDSRLQALPNVFINQRYFQSEDVEAFSNRNDVFFLSDIRNLSYSKEQDITEEGQRLNTEMTMKDMKMQMEWVEKIKPVKAHLKFLLPYTYNWTTNTKFQYLDGEVYKQAFATQTSTECRLVPNLDVPLRNWDTKVYEEMMFYHNNVIREHISFINPLTNINEPISPTLGLLQDYDSTVFVVTVREYLTKFNGPTTPESVLQLCQAIIDDISRGTVSIVGIRSGTNSDAQLLSIQKALKDMGEDQEE